MANRGNEQGKKWIHTIVAVCAALTAYVLVSFFDQLGEWLDLEAKIAHFGPIVHGISVALGVLTYILIVKNASAFQYLTEVYGELVKVVWAKRDETVKLTVGIVIGVIISSIALGAVDFGIGKLLGLLYK